MVRRAFQRRPGRVIALGRLVFALLVLAVVWLEPPAAALDPGTIFASYAAWAAILLAVTWRSWWLDHRLSDLSHLVDIAAGAVLAFFVGYQPGLFYAFFVFLVLSAALRWNARETALTAAAVTLFFLTAGMVELATGTADFDTRALLVRVTILVVLSLILIWFRINEMPPPSGEEEAPATDGPPIETALARAASRLAARRVLIAWSQPEEPWMNVSQLEGDAVRTEKLGPEEHGSLVANGPVEVPMLFDLRRGRGLTRVETEAHRTAGLSPDFDRAFAERYGLVVGLAVPLRAENYRGEMFATGIDGLCAGDLAAAEQLSAEMTALFDRSSRAAVSEEAAVNRARMALARDLHDGVVQALAGAAFRLEAIKAAIRAGEDPGAEIEAVKAELKEEQRNVRTFIAGLRSGRGWDRTTDLSSGLPAVAEQLRRRWGIACDLSGVEAPTEGPLWMEHELHQILHESAANAVRHGDATELAIRFARDGDALELMIVDNGKGMRQADRNGGTRSKKADDGLPWSVGERVRTLGGVLKVVGLESGTRVQVRLPAGGTA